MKIAMITDLHYGARNGNVNLQNSMNRFVNETVLPEMEKRGIDRLYVLGDFTDSRKSTNYAIIKDIKENFFDVLQKKGVSVYILGGNHDMFYRESNDVASFDVLFGSYDNVKVITKPVEDDGILLLPWINKTNNDEVRNAILASQCDLCFGHLEIEGAKMYANSRAEHGMQAKPFDKFTSVFSGHFHHRSRYGNIQYIGAAGYYTWQDYDDFRGMTILDTESHKQETVENPFCRFKRIVYDDTNGVGDYTDCDLSGLKDKYVDLVVTNKDNEAVYQDFLKQINGSGFIDLKITDTTMLKEFIEDGEDDEELETKEVVDLVRDYVKDAFDNSEDLLKIINEVLEEVKV